MEINVSWCHLISENGVEALARGCVKLRKFSSKGCKQINDNAIMCLAKYCPDLMVLNLHSCEVGLHFVQILLHYNCLLLIADHKRFIDPPTGRQLPQAAETVRVQVRGSHRSHAAVPLAAQSPAEHPRGVWMPKLHGHRLSGAGAKLQVSGAHGFGRV